MLKSSWLPTPAVALVALVATGCGSAARQERPTHDATAPRLPLRPLPRRLRQRRTQFRR